MLSSERLDLVPFSDVNRTSVSQTYLKWLNDKEVTRLIASPSLQGKANMSTVDEGFRRFTSDSCRGFFILNRDTSEFIGTAKIDKIDLYHSSAELGIMIGEKAFWGKGISKEVYVSMMKHGFMTMELNRLWGGTNQYNQAMRRTFLSVGFRQEGILRQANRIDGVFSDSYIYSILRSEYLERHVYAK
jgi:ribosomal-protein-alanine N-acetyltransferase